MLSFENHMSKHKKYFKEMWDSHNLEFESFQKIHDAYVVDSSKWQMEFNTKGRKIVDIIRNWERLLCQKSEAGKYGKFSSNLSDKFWSEVRVHFPKIDFVGTTSPM